MIPRHVAACHHSPVARERWFVHTWKRANTAIQSRVPYCCNSWRCAVCRRYEAAVTFARLKQAAAGLDPLGWCFIVLTLDRNGTLGGQPWPDVKTAYKELGNLTNKALKRIGRIWGPESRLECSGRSKKLRTVRYLGNRWVAVVEAHRSGHPHMNLMIWCPELAAALRAAQAERLEDPEIANALALAQDAWRNKEPIPHDVRELARKASVVGGGLRDLLVATGWGAQSTAEAARDIEAVFGYGVKLCGLHDASVGELAKVTQVPMAADERFRRLRSGKGFLPPRITNPEVTGCLVRRRRSYEGDWEICAINPPKDPEQLEPIARARSVEFQLIREEEDLLSKGKGKLPPMPPIRYGFSGCLEPHRETSERRAAMQSEALAAAG